MSVKPNKNLDWKPGDYFCIRLDDKTGEERVPPQSIDAMVEAIRPIVEDYGFTIDFDGSWRSARVVALGELHILEQCRHDEEEAAV